MARSALNTILPLLIAVIILGALAAVGFVAYSIAIDVAEKAEKKMQKKNMSISKDGLKVGVKEVSAEQVGDSTQSVLMKAWNASSWPAYKSSLGWGQGQGQGQATADKRKTYSRTDSGKVR